MSGPLSAPFPWFGGKRKVAREVWERFGAVRNYVEPFFGSGAVLLGRPDVVGNETINDLDGYVTNFWRSVQLSPETVAEWADNPVNENDLHARHVWLLQQRDTLRPRLEGDPDWHDPKIAGWSHLNEAFFDPSKAERDEGRFSEADGVALDIVQDALERIKALLTGGDE